MGMTSLYRRFGAWLALLALLLGALAPAVTQAVVIGSERAGWVQICSVSGMTWVQLDAGQEGAPADMGAASGCTWCTGQGAGGLPPAPTAWVQPDARQVAPAQAFASALLARAWAPAQSRAPPRL